MHVFVNSFDQSKAELKLLTGACDKKFMFQVDLKGKAFRNFGMTLYYQLILLIAKTGLIVLKHFNTIGR